MECPSDGSSSIRRLVSAGFASAAYLLLCNDVIPQSFQHRFFFCRQRKAEKRTSAVGPSTRRIAN
ncbi:hypothetical protein V8C43DRAFT_294436 [Trichoderma afarasin]